VERRQLDRGGVEVSRIALGCGNFGGIGSAPEFFGQGEAENDALAIMNAAWSGGITTFDTADAYGGGRSETAVGRWLLETGRHPAITTKTYNPMTTEGDCGLSRERIKRQIASSLERLGCERVELYLAHAFDPATPLAETVATFESLVDEGTILAWGVSNFDGDALRATLAVGRPALVQNSYSLLDRGDERDVLPLCVEHGIAYEGYSPLAGGWLTGKYQRGAAPPTGSRMSQRPEPYEHLRTATVFDGLDRFAEAARERGVDMPTLAHAWLLAQAHVTAIVVGPRRTAHLAAAFRALDVELSERDAAEIAGFFP
jgi:aryl-alcohol dehydrogenase-like predicted oxidoreductase